MVPAWLSTTRLAIGKPSPQPLAFVETSDRKPAQCLGWYSRAGILTLIYRRLLRRGNTESLPAELLAVRSEPDSKASGATVHSPLFRCNPNADGDP
jgi:hypothetical protein